METGRGIKIGTLNIRDGRQQGLEEALKCMEEMKVDIAVLTETKFKVGGTR